MAADIHIEVLNILFNMEREAENLAYSPERQERLATLYEAIRLIEAVPSTDVQPVRHGCWSECYTDSHHYSGICSVCGHASIKNLTESLYEYCPRCGAKMDIVYQDENVTARKVTGWDGEQDE